MRRSAAVTPLIALLCLAAVPGQEAPVASPPRSAQSPPAVSVQSRHGLEDPGRVEAFFDGLMHGLMHQEHVAGATVAVVSNGQVILAKGYGYDDFEARREVDAERTLFRIGSISKTFIWTAVMQLVEAGRLDLDTDVNTYLSDFQIPATYDEPITLTHLLTHSAGFEDQVLGLFARDASGLAPLGEILRRELPARVRPPGSVSSYSNHGAGIAAYIVEQVSGMSFDDYVEQRMLGTLGMAHTTFRQPVPESLPARMSKGYRWTGEYREVPFEYVPLAPVGAASSSAVDMARYMTAHLQLGELDGARILQPETARRMQSELFRQAPHMNPMDYGLYDMSRNHERVIGHGGDTLWFHSEMALLPERGVGMFVSTNSEAGSTVTGRVSAAFMDEYFPVDEVPDITPTVDATEAAQLQRFAGHYRANRYSHRTLAKLAALGAVTVEVTGPGELRLSADRAARWVQVEPLLFRERRGERYLAFRADERGQITHMFLSSVPVLAFERLGAWGNPTVHAGVAGFVILMQLGVLLLWPVAAFVRWRHRFAYDKGPPRGARFVAWVACLLLVVTVVLLALGLADPDQIVFGIPAILVAALTLPLLAVPFAFASLGYAAGLWRSGRVARWQRVVYSLLVSSFVGAYWLLWYWNLLGYRY